MPTLNSQQNSPVCYCLHYLTLPVHFCFLFSVLFYSLLLDVLLYHIYNTFLSFFLSLAFSNLLPMSVYVVIKTSRLPIFVIVVFGFLNFHKYFSAFINYSYFSSIIISTLCGIIFLSNWDNCHLSFVQSF